MQNFELYFNLCRVLNVDDIHIIEYDKLQKCVSHNTYVCMGTINMSGEIHSPLILMFAQGKH